MYKFHFKTKDEIRSRVVERSYLYHWGKMVIDAVTDEKGEFIIDTDTVFTVRVEKIAEAEQKEKAKTLAVDLKKAQELIDKTAVTIKKPVS